MAFLDVPSGEFVVCYAVRGGPLWTHDQGPHYEQVLCVKSDYDFVEVKLNVRCIVGVPLPHKRPRPKSESPP